MGNKNDCTSCDLGYRCNRCDEETKQYKCPISGPYEVIEYENKQYRIDKLSATREASNTNNR